MATDSRGKSISNENISIKEASAALLSSLTQVINFANESKSKNKKVNDAVNNAASSKKQNLKEDIDKDKKWVNKLIDFIENFGKGNKNGQRSSRSKGKDSEIGALNRIAQATENLWMASQKQKTFWVGISEISSVAQRAITAAINKSDYCNAANKMANKANSASIIGKKGGGGIIGNLNNSVNNGGGGGGKNGIGMPGGDGGDLSKNLVSLASAASVAAGAFSVIYGKMVAAMDLDPFKHVFSGVITDSNTFRENLRQIMHQQVGFTSSNRDMEKAYADVSSATITSGLTRAEFDKLWLSNMQKGLMLSQKTDLGRLKAVNQLKSVTSTVGNTAMALDMNVESVNQTFMDWHYHLAMSANDIAEMGRHMQTVARSTGVTGKEMDKAMSSAAKVTKSLQDAGLASVKALKSLTQIMAISQKYGIDQQMTNIQTALSGAEGFSAADDGTKNFLRMSSNQAGINFQDVKSGSISQNPEMQKKLYGGMEKNMRRFLSQTAGAALADMGLDANTLDLTKFNEVNQQMSNRSTDKTLSQGERDRASYAQITMQTLAKQQTGMGVGDFQGLQKFIEDSKMNNGQRLEKMMSDLSSLRLSGKGGTDEAKQLGEQLAAAQTNATMTGFTELQNTLTKNNVTSINQLSGQTKAALEASLKESMGQEGASKFLNNLSGATSDLMKTLEGRASKIGVDMNSMAKEGGFENMAQLQAKIQQGGQEGQQALNALNAIQQRIANKERVAQDPATELRDQLRETNIILRQIADSALMKISNGLFQVIYWVGQVLAVLGGLLGVAYTIDSALGLFGSGLGAAIGTALEVVLAPLLVLFGGMKGFFESSSAGVSKGQGTLMGMLTGGAGTGSMLSPMMGIQKGSAGDKALGVASAAAYGAAIGTAISPGLGTVIGLITSSAFEILKILTEGTDIIQKYFVDPISWVLQPLWSIVKGLGKLVGGLLTLNWDTFKSGLTDLMSGLWNISIGNMMKFVQRFGEMLVSLVLEIPNMFFQSIKFVFLELPNMILNSISSALTSLANDEYVGAIFKPVLELWTAIRSSFDQIYAVIKPALDEVNKAWNQVKDSIWKVIAPIFDVISESKMLSKVLWFMGQTVKVSAEAIGYVIKTALQPLIFTFQSIALVVGTVIKCVKEVIDWFAWLYVQLVGNSIVPDLVMGIIKFFLMLPANIMKALAGLGSEMIGWIGGFLMNLPGMIWNALKDVGTMIFDSFTSIFTSLFDWMKNTIPGLGGAVEGFGETNAQANARIDESGYSTAHGVGRTAGGIWEMLSGGSEGFFSIAGRWEGLEKTFGGAWEAIAGAATGIWDTAKEWMPSVTDTLSDTWSGVSDFFGGVGDFFSEANGSIGGLASEAWDATTGFISSAASGLGETVSAAYDSGQSFVGDVQSALSAGLSKVGSAISNSNFNPLNWFENGTREIDQGGLAVLHEGEMILPKNVWEEIKAIGNGDFGDGGGVMEGFGSIEKMLMNSSGGSNDLFGGISPTNEGAFDPDSPRTALETAISINDEVIGISDILSSGFETLIDLAEESLSRGVGILDILDGMLSSGPISYLSQVFSSLGQGAGSIMGGLGLGLFSGDIASQANSSFSTNGAPMSDLEKLNSASNSNKNLSGMASQNNAGLFDENSINEAMSQSVSSFANSSVYNSDFNDIVSSAIKSKNEVQKQQVLAEVSRALNYESAGSEAANATNANQFSGENYSGEVSTNPLDYTDQLEGEVSTSNYITGSAGGDIQQQRASAEVAGAAALVSMDELVKLGEMNIDKYETMISLLQTLVDNSRPGTLSQIVGVLGGGTPPPQRTGVKSISRDFTRGFWDMQFGDYSAGSIATDGRGGSA